MEIQILKATENQTVNLLTRVVEILQEEKNGLQNKCKSIETEIIGLKNQNETYQQTLLANETTIDQLNKSIIDLTNQISTSEKKHETELDNLNKEKIGNKKINDELTQKNTQLEKQKITLTQENEKLGAELERINIRRVKDLILIIEKSLSYDVNHNLSDNWKDFLANIQKDMTVFVDSVDNIKSLNRKIVIKNGWFAKLASIKWWHHAPCVQSYLPVFLQKDSLFNFAFDSLLNLLKEFDIDVYIPQGDFTDSINNYTIDYDYPTMVRELFVDYKPEHFVLCEINYVSFNGNSGCCLGYKP